MNPAPGKNYFELFGLPVSFDINLDELAARYRELQRHVHPDKFANASDQDRRLSMQMTALINEGFRTFKDPVQRAQYLLSLRGIDLNSETDTTMNPAFLMEQMEWREELEEVAQAAKSQERLTAFANRIEQRLQEKIEQFRRAFEMNTPDETAKARNAVREMQFLEKMRREIDDLEEELI
jgi:molecular chaperone HscB